MCLRYLPLNGGTRWKQMKMNASWRDFSWLLNATESATNLLYRTGCTWPVNSWPWNWRKLKSAECWRDNSSPTLHQTESRLVVKGFLFVGSLCGETTICFQILLGRYKPWLQAYPLQDSLQNQGPSHFITGHLFTKWGGAPLFFMFFQSTNKTGQKRRSKSTRLLRFFGWIEILFGSHKPWILSVGRGPVKLSELSDFGWCCFALLTNCQVDSWVVRFSNLSVFNVDFAVSHWDSTGEDGSRLERIWLDPVAIIRPQGSYLQFPSLARWSREWI